MTNRRVSEQKLPPGTTLARGFRDASSIKWPLVPARDIFELKYGKALVEADRRPGSVPVYGTNGRCGYHDTALFLGPGVILGRKGQGPLGVEWCESDYWVIDTAYSLAPLRADVDLKYAYYLIKFVGLNHLKDGTSNPSLSRDTFGVQALPLPPLPVQRAIAHILGTLDDKIELNRRMNETLEAMARAIFQSWFVNFDPVRAKIEGRDMELPKEIADFFPDRFEDSELGEIPAGWEVHRLSDLLSLDKGLSYKGQFLGDSGVPMVNLGCFLGRGRFEAQAIKYYSGDFQDRHTVRPFDLVLANTDITQKREVIGSPALIPPHENSDKLIFTHHVYAARFRNGSDPWKLFVYFSLLQEGFRERATGFATGTTVLALPRDAVLEFQYPAPPPSIIKAFDSGVMPIVERQWESIEESKTRAALRDLLAPKLISGELQARDAERFLKEEGV